MVLSVSHQLELNHCYSLTGAYIALKQKMTRRGKSRAKSSPTKPRRVNKLTLQKQTALKAFRTILSDCEFTETQGVLQNLLSSKAVSYTHLRAPRDGLLSRMPSSA